MSCLLKNEPASYSYAVSLSPIKSDGGVGKPSVKARLTACGRPETERANHGQGEVPRNRDGGPNPCQLQLAGMTCG